MEAGDEAAGVLQRSVAGFVPRGRSEGLHPPNLLVQPFVASVRRCRPLLSRLISRQDIRVSRKNLAESFCRPSAPRYVCLLPLATGRPLCLCPLLLRRCRPLSLVSFIYLCIFFSLSPHLQVLLPFV